VVTTILFLDASSCCFILLRAALILSLVRARVVVSFVAVAVTGFTDDDWCVV
jgi:hypothetical protein